MRFNVTSAFSMTKLVVPHMVKSGGGVILNISSTMSWVTDRGFVAYGTSKAALSHMTRLLANEFAPKVRVNAIAPGAVLTSALAPFVEDKKMNDGLVGATPMRRLGTVEDIATAAIFLCSDAGSFVTGKIYGVDGGIETSNFPLTMPDL
jgi:7-alpha-hydroxysteroid dehydrogenase